MPLENSIWKDNAPDPGFLDKQLMRVADELAKNLIFINYEANVNA